MPDLAQTRYHAEIKGSIERHEVRVNVFADDLEEIFTDLSTIAAELALPTVSKPKSNSAPQNPTPIADKPLCNFCGTDQFMQLVTWSDDQGNSKSAWKCQQCQKWHWPNKKGRGA